MQLSLFNEIEDTIDHSDDNDLKETITYDRSKKKKSKVDYSNLEVKTIHHNLKDLNCPNCNSKLKELKEDIYETLVYKPAEYYIEKHIVHNYVCNKCSKETDSLVSFKALDIPNKLINKSLASSSVISNIAYNKFILDIPLYRQEADLKRQGINISRQNMSNWLMIASNDYLEYIFNKMHEDIKKCKYLHADETTLTVIEDKKD